MMDNFCEAYHVPVCHKGLSSLLDDDSYKIDVYDTFVAHSSGTVDNESRLGGGALYIQAFPNLGFNRYGKF